MKKYDAKTQEGLLANEFAFKVRQRRHERGLLLKDVGASLGVTAAAISLIEQGNPERTNFVLRMAAAQNLGLDAIDGLFSRTDGERALIFLKRFQNFCGISDEVMEPTMRRIRERFSIQEAKTGLKWRREMPCSNRARDTRKPVGAGRQ